LFVKGYEQCMTNLEMTPKNRRLVSDVFENLMDMNFGDAERICLRMLDTEDKLVRLSLLGLTYYLMCNIQASSEVIDEVLAINNDYLPAVNLASDILYITKRLEEAEFAIKKSISLDKTQRNPRLLLADLYQTTNRQIEALTILEGLYQDLPEDAIVWSNICQIHDEMGTIQRAEEMLKAEVQRCKENFGAWHNLGVIYHDQFRFEEAENALLKALEIYSGETNTLFTLGSVYKLSGRIDEATLMFRKVLESDPDDAKALFELSSSLFFQGKLDEARRVFSKAVKLDPSLRNNSMVIGF
jgi:tetratricopeptide (TPR) repeat protein